MQGGAAAESVRLTAEEFMKDKNKKILFKLSGGAALISACVLSIANMVELCEGSGAAVVLAVVFEVIGIVCLAFSEEGKAHEDKRKHDLPYQKRQ